MANKQTAPKPRKVASKSTPKPSKNTNMQRVTFSVKQVEGLLAKVQNKITQRIDHIHATTQNVLERWDQFEEWLERHQKIGFWVKCLAVLVGLSIANQILHLFFFH